MPHLVSPLSGCLSRHTPTRATRGEARGHRSVLAQNSLLMYPPSFSFLWTCRRSGVSSPYGGLAPMCLRCCGCIPAWFLSMSLLCGHVGRRRAHSTMALALCVVCASPRGVGVDRRRACPHRRDVGALVHSRCQWWCDPLGNNGPCEVVCVPIAVVQPTLVTPDGRECWGMRVRSLGIHLWVCVVAVMGLCDRGFGTSWRHPIDTGRSRLSPQS